MTVELYPNTNSLGNRSLWSSSSSGAEVDLRDEFEDFLYGSGTEIAKGRPFIFRRMRRNDDNNLIKCLCVDELTNEPDRDSICPFCWGCGYTWDEEWITAYKVTISSGGNRGLTLKNTYEKPGLINAPTVFFYVEYDIEPELVDMIIEPSLDTEGQLVVPYKREIDFRFSSVEAMRSDRGRVEYWRIAAIAETVKATWNE